MDKCIIFLTFIFFWILYQLVFYSIALVSMQHIKDYLTSYPRHRITVAPWWNQMISFVPQIFFFTIRLMCISILWICFIAQAFDIWFFYNDRDYTNIPTNTSSTYVGGIIKSGTVIDDSLTVRLIQRFYDPNFDPTISQPAIYYIKFLVDVALSFIAFIALCFLIYYLYIIFLSDSDAGIEQAKGYALNAFVAICLIGLSRIIVSFAFYLYNLFLSF